MLSNDHNLPTISRGDLAGLLSPGTSNFLFFFLRSPIPRSTTPVCYSVNYELSKIQDVRKGTSLAIVF